VVWRWGVCFLRGGVLLWLLWLGPDGGMRGVWLFSPSLQFDSVTLPELRTSAIEMRVAP